MTSKLSVALILMCSSFICRAQVGIAAFGGFQTTTARYTVKGIRQPNGFKYGAMAGLALKVPFENHLYFFPSVYYSLKGYKVTLNNPANPPTEVAKNNNTTIHTIEIAPLFQIDLSSKPCHFFVRFGPSADFAFSAREKFDTLSNTGVSGRVERSMRFGFTDYGRFTVSGNVHFGYETSKDLMIFLYYSHGLGSMNNADDGPHILHRIVGVSAGWYFARKR